MVAINIAQPSATVVITVIGPRMFARMCRPSTAASLQPRARAAST